MRKRWQVLSAISSFGVMSFAAIIARFGFQSSTWFLLGLVGFSVACGVALWAAIVDHHKRWPAAVALLACSPFAERLIGGIRGVSWWRGNFLTFQIVVCSLLTVVAAVAILVMKVPARDGELPPARTL